MTTMTQTLPGVEYKTFGIRDLTAISHTDEKTGKKTIESVAVNGQPVDTHQRFWNSLFARYGFSKNVFNYFAPAEVFDRIANVREDDTLRFCFLTEKGMHRPKLMAVSNPNKPVFVMDKITELLGGYDPDGGIKYADGIIRASFSPRGEAPFEIGGDSFNARFDTLIPIDGYGSPEVALGCLRLVCTNGMTAFGKVFSNKIPVGSDLTGGLSRISQTIEGYGNDEGFDALRRRLTSATESYASVAECSMMANAVMRAVGAEGMERQEIRQIVDNFDRVAGNPTMMYGLINTTAVGRKRLATLPSRASVYDLINFGTEVATHHVGGEGTNRGIQSIVGGLLGGEFDLEGSARDKERDHIDVFLDSERNLGASKHAVTSAYAGLLNEDEDAPEVGERMGN